MNKLAQYRLIEKAAARAGDELFWADPKDTKAMKKVRKRVEGMKSAPKEKVIKPKRGFPWHHRKVRQFPIKGYPMRLVPKSAIAIPAGIFGAVIAANILLDKIESRKKDKLRTS